MVDRYQEDINKAKGILNEIKQISKERSDAKGLGKSTARFDYKLKMKLESIKTE